MRYFLVLLSISYLGASLCVWGLSRIVPWFLLPDFSFLSIVFAGLFIQGPLGFFCALFPAIIREITTAASPWSIFFGSMALYFATREISSHFIIRDEYSLLAMVVALLALESLSIVAMLMLDGAGSFSLLWGAQEAVRITWTSLIAVPLFMDLSRKWRRVKD
ncbi:MAG: hypothetical protein FWF95_06965 [Syntrophorhabdaceae bacterium]|nr:hypothetical protein [Syntrophorhabdaceae bacterium]